MIENVLDAYAESDETDDAAQFCSVYALLRRPVRLIARRPMPWPIST